MKEPLIKLLGSILKAASFSAALSIAAYFAGVSIIMTFSISFISQFIVSYLYNSYLELKAAKILQEQRLKELEILSRITLSVNCAACKLPNEVVINVNSDNNFDCEHCKAKNTVYISAEAALVTIPVATKPI